MTLHFRTLLLPGLPSHPLSLKKDIKCYLILMLIINVKEEHSFPKVTVSVDNKNLFYVFVKFIVFFLQHSKGITKLLY